MKKASNVLMVMSNMELLTLLIGAEAAGKVCAAYPALSDISRATAED
jgi:hypothetical protein